MDDDAITNPVYRHKGAQFELPQGYVIDTFGNVVNLSGLCKDSIFNEQKSSQNKLKPPHRDLIKSKNPNQRIEYIPNSSRIKRSGFMENPYIGKDGRDYHSIEALREANKMYNNSVYQKIPKRPFQ